MHEKYSDWKPNFLCISICYIECVWVCICTIFQASAHRKSETEIIKSIGKRLMPDLSFRIFYKKKLDWGTFEASPITFKVNNPYIKK